MSVADRAPVLLGVKVRTTVHVPPLLATVAPLIHVVPADTIAKSLSALPGAPMVTALLAARWRSRPPELVSVTVRLLLVTPTIWLEVKVAGLGFGVTCAATPEPVRETDCIVPATAPASSVITRVTGPYERTVVGVKVTLIVHEPLAGIAKPLVHVVVPPIPKNVESALAVIAAALAEARFSVSVPLFVTVSDM